MKHVTHFTTNMVEECHLSTLYPDVSKPVKFNPPFNDTKYHTLIWMQPCLTVKLIDAQLANKYFAIYGTYQPTTGPYPESDKYSPHLPWYFAHSHYNITSSSSSSLALQPLVGFGLIL
jgi:hypothetical protein